MIIRLNPDENFIGFYVDPIKNTKIFFSDKEAD